VDFLIFLNKDIFLSIFALKCDGMLQDTKKHLFCNFERLWSVGWQENGFKAKKQKTKSLDVAPFDPTKKMSIIFIIIEKLRFLPTFLCRKFIYNVFVFELYAFLNGSNLGNVKTVFFPQNDITMTSPVGATGL